MPWGAVAGVAGSLISSQLNKKENGGAGTSTNTKEPWAPAQGWIADNLNSGKALQAQYALNPQSAEQQQAVKNIYGQSDYMRGLVPSLLGQIQGQQVGFDPSNPTAKPKAWNWDSLLGSAPNLGQGTVSDASSKIPANVAAAAPAASNFVDYNMFADPKAGAGIFANGQMGVRDGTNDLMAMGLNSSGAGMGAFKYGQRAPDKGTQAYADMQAYLQRGGQDPFGLYGAASGGTALSSGLISGV